MTIVWSLKTIPIKDLTAHRKNARRLTKEQARHLSISLDKFGLIDKPVVNLDNTIIGGHQRVNILKRSERELECWFPDRMLTEKELDELNIRLNANQGEWDDDILANCWDQDELISWGVKDLDFDDKPEEEDLSSFVKITIEVNSKQEASIIEEWIEHRFPEATIKVK